ncbi:catechol-2,3-dioxygenase [Curtobacterium sp. PhB25]|nr:catechol-2,3-dioxygenase [Curtobacterium sp. PhB191]TDW74853.1 catechol-2,3-dioxygenase [Curtobacterium sp. PhB25]
MADMDIRQAQLATRSLDDTARFWERLGCPVDRVDGVVEVVVGSTRLLFRELPGMTGALHLAITIPTGTFAAAAEWIAGIATVLVDADGRDEFEGPPNWNSRSVYFEGPDEQLLELIERRDLAAAAPASGPASAAPAFASAVPLLSVSEVGIAVPDVLGAVEKLRRAGLEPYANPAGEGFAAVGDVDGLVILVSPERRWFPTADRLPSTAPVVLDVGLDAPVELTPGVLLR